VAKLVWRVNLVTELEAGETMEVEVALVREETFDVWSLHRIPDQVGGARLHRTISAGETNRRERRRNRYVTALPPDERPPLLPI
jgi:hypothetical protein